MDPYFKWKRAYSYCMSSFWLANGLLLRLISTYDAWDTSYPSKYKNAHVNLSELKSFKTPLFIVLLCQRFYYATFLVFLPFLSHHSLSLSLCYRKKISKKGYLLHCVNTDGFNCACKILEFNFCLWLPNIFQHNKMLE